jgi:uncharacterized protein YndB with AHSA1/START domain
MSSTTNTSNLLGDQAHLTAGQIYVILIKAPPERIWEAITQPAFVAQYFHDCRLDVELRPGGSYRSFSPDRSEKWVEAEVIEVDPPRRFVHGWRSLYNPDTAKEEPSRVTWEIEDVGNDVSKLTVTHDQLERSPLTAVSVSGIGWMTVLSGLKTLLETGAPLGFKLSEVQAEGKEQGT